MRDYPGRVPLLVWNSFKTSLPLFNNSQLLKRVDFSYAFDKDAVKKEYK